MNNLRKPIWKTEDNEDVFDGDTVSWVICNYGSKQWEYAYDLSLDIRNLVCVQKSPEIYKVFKNKDKMNTGIEEMNRPKFVEGEWLLYKKGCEEWLFRFKSYTTDGDLNHKESYHIDSETGKLYESKSGWFYNRNVIKADTDTIQRILSKVAISKGFKEGTRFKSLITETNRTVTGFKYCTLGDILFNKNGGRIYDKSQWATIVENTIPEYVKCIFQDKDGSQRFTVGKIYKLESKSEDDKLIILSDNGKNNNEEGYPWNGTLWKFTKSNKAEYDLQEFKKNSKQVTVIVDGDVTSISSFGSEVKINYQIK